MSDDDRPQSDSPSQLPKSNPEKFGFVPEALDRTVIAIPLLRDLKKEDVGDVASKAHRVIIDLNLEFPGDEAFGPGRSGARDWV
ncbi:MAG TPA: hypothetical protein VHP99_20245, partial [Pyrinomonadaceae bacterium]|nr:hypothetical protein [Pyrinomonadaceae bacterium]